MEDLEQAEGAVATLEEGCHMAVVVGILRSDEDQQTAVALRYVETQLVGVVLDKQGYGRDIGLALVEG